MCKSVRSFSSDTALNDVLVHTYVCAIITQSVGCYACNKNAVSFGTFCHELYV